MDRPQFIHMITLIGAATGIQKRIHTGYQQAAFMHRHGEGAGKDSTSLSVLERTIAKQKRVVS